MNSRWGLASALAVAFLADLVSTWSAFQDGAVESNPFLASARFHEILGAKTVVLCGVLAFLKWDSSPWPEIVAIFGAVATIAVSVSNSVQLATYVHPSWGLLAAVGPAIVSLLIFASYSPERFQKLWKIKVMHE